MLGVGNNRVGDHKTVVVESSDGFELSDDNKFVETNGTHKTNRKPSNKEGSLEEAEAVQAATDERRDREVRNTIQLELEFQKGGNVGHWQFP